MRKVFVYKNNCRQLNKNNFIGILLKGKDKNTFAIGSKIKLYIGDQILSREVVPARGISIIGRLQTDYRIGVPLQKLIQCLLVGRIRTYSRLYKCSGRYCVGNSTIQ